MTHYDLIIIGTGSAGLPAGMYASRYHLTNCIIGALPGGALATSHQVENYPWIVSDSGRSIMDRFAEHARVSGSEILADEVTAVERTDAMGFAVRTASHGTYTSDTLLLATGNDYRHLGVPWEDDYLGRGVSYCATCDGMFFRGRDVVMVGGGDAALTESLYLAELCKSVTILYRGDTLRAEDIWVEKANNTQNISIRYRTEITEIRGSVLGVESVLLKDGEEIPCEWVFIAIGSEPNTRLVDPLGIAKDTSGCVIVDTRQATNIPWLYAAGDVTTGSNKFRQTIMSAAEGCLAAHSIHEDRLRAGHKR